MSKVSKEFWVSDDDLRTIVENKELSVVLRCKDESKLEGIFEKAVHKITISYEIDREVTIKESEFDWHLQDWVSKDCNSSFSAYLKKKLFGGGENE